MVDLWCRHFHRQMDGIAGGSNPVRIWLLDPLWSGLSHIRARGGQSAEHHVFLLPSRSGALSIVTSLRDDGAVHSTCGSISSFALVPVGPMVTTRFHHGPFTVVETATHDSSSGSSRHVCWQARSRQRLSLVQNSLEVKNPPCCHRLFNCASSGARAGRT